MFQTYMNANQIRQAFLDFFSKKSHHVVASAPMVVKNDPTLMFTNAGMNQFKDIFLGNHRAEWPRVANSQKCLRVSGKHNDLEEVGHDTYHHTMFEMLGNWSFGDYFKKEAIAWAWELLTDIYGLDPERLYVTVFEGNKEDGLEADQESKKYWEDILPGERILYGSKKDNFWEMGDTGPCGPCSEIHIDLRSDEQRRLIPGKDLVNHDHPLVVEIWNLVFIEFNRQSDGSLKVLPARHVDTGMGFERLCMALQAKKSNYDTDVFTPLINRIARLSGITYGSARESDVAMRVVADHLRAVSFSVADGQLPSNNKAGYVIRRILRRAVRYGYTFLGMREPFVFQLVPVLVDQMGEAFPELKAQQQLIERVIQEEEAGFLRTLAQGIHKFEQYVAELNEGEAVSGAFIFELFDTYGFPPDLTRLMAAEKGRQADMASFENHMSRQRSRSRAVLRQEEGDWVILEPFNEESLFLGYEKLKARVRVMRYRQVKQKEKSVYHLVLDQTPFYAESGGQVGDRGELTGGGWQIQVLDTRKENNLVIHVCDRIPEGDWPESFMAIVDEEKRRLTASNHSATHLLHSALRQVLGEHVQQKGSLVDEQRLRFDFSHFSRLSSEELRLIERMVNKHIRANTQVLEHRELTMEKALEMGALALFGEKYGEKVRVVSVDPGFSTELCGGTHVMHTGQIGFFKILSEGAIAAGIRRIEAVTGARAEDFLYDQLDELGAIKEKLNYPREAVKAIEQLMTREDEMKKALEAYRRKESLMLHDELLKSAQQGTGYRYIISRLEMDAQSAKDLAFSLSHSEPNLCVVLGHIHQDKPGLTIMIPAQLAKEKGWHAGNMIKELARNIRGGGGGQAHFATAGGSLAEGLDQALNQAETLISGTSF